MKRLICIISVALFLLTSCTGIGSGKFGDDISLPENSDTGQTAEITELAIPEDIRSLTQPFGDMPAGFSRIVGEDLFGSGTAAHGIVASLTDKGSGYELLAHDYSGSRLARIDLPRNGYKTRPYVYPTSDRGLLVAYGAQVVYDTSDIDANSSMFVKYDLNGNIMFSEKVKYIYEKDLCYFCEYGDGFIFFGAANYNINLLKLGLDGKVLAKKVSAEAGWKAFKMPHLTAMPYIWSSTRPRTTELLRKEAIIFANSIKMILI